MPVAVLGLFGLFASGMFNQSLRESLKAIPRALVCPVRGFY